MRFLVDENMDDLVVARLRAAGHEVSWARETHRSAADPSLLELANQEGRTLITYDRDFGELVHKRHLPAPFGVVLFRIYQDMPRSTRAEFIARNATVWDSWPPGIWTVQIRHQPAP